MPILLQFTDVKLSRQKFSPKTKAAGFQSLAVHQCTTTQEYTMYDWEKGSTEQLHLLINLKLPHQLVPTSL